MKTTLAAMIAIVVVIAAVMPAAHSQDTNKRGARTKYSKSSNTRSRGRPSTTPGGEPLVHHCLVSLIEQVRIPAAEAGVVKRLYVREGYRVWKYIEEGEEAESGLSAEEIKKGRALVMQIDDTLPLRSARVANYEWIRAKTEADNDVNILFAQKSAAVSEAEYRASKLANERVPGTVPKVEMDRLKLTWERAVLQIKQSLMEQDLARGTMKVKEEELAATNDSIRERKIHSPIDGVVTHLFVQEGEWVRAGDPVMRVINLERLRVEGFLKIREHNPHDLQNKTVTIEVPMTGGQVEKFSGKITVVHHEVQAGGMYRVWAEVENRVSPSGRFVLKPGLDATMTIHTKGPTVAAVQVRK